ncbi:hypothetical protein HYC85_027718 [Camellia sinensis]|uniref:Aminotransferase-like plant mobile domain-containing protein n=1 Tax=Camellia sinensis TaxID=4442 RepID=A0A7J7FTW2_CAMSI|nr:hypothetical protein HYC85_027718 [Camellia sinensis]
MWASLLIPRELFIGTTNPRAYKCIAEPYCPAQFARQFGFTQGVPIPLCSNTNLTLTKRDLKVRKSRLEEATFKFMDDLATFEYIPFIPQGTFLKRYQSWWVSNMEVYLAISPQNLLEVLDVPKPKGAEITTSSIVPSTTQFIPATSTPLRVTRAVSKKSDQKQKKQRLLEPEKKTIEVQEEEKEDEKDQAHESPLMRRKMVIDLSQEETTTREVEEEVIFKESEPQAEGVEKTIEEQTMPVQRKKRRKITVSPSEFDIPPSNFDEDSDSETIAQAIGKRRKMTASTTALIEDPLHEAAAKAVEQEYSKAIVVFERAEKKRQQQILRERAAAADALQRELARRQRIARHYSLRSSPISTSSSGTTTTTALTFPMRPSSISVEVDQMQNVRVVRIVLPLPKPIFDVSSLSPSIPASLFLGLQPYLPFLARDLPQSTFPLSLALFPSFTETLTAAPFPVAVDSSTEDTGSPSIHGSSPIPTSSPSSLDLLVAKTIEAAKDAPSVSPIPMQPFASSTTTLSMPFMSRDEVDIFEGRLASLFDIPSTSPTSTVEAEPLVLVDSLLKIFKSSPSFSNKPFAPSVDLDTCLQLLTSFSRIPFEALQRPIIRNGFLQCCNIAEQSGMSVSSHLSQAAATIDFYLNICHAAKTADEKLAKDQSFVSQVHTEVSTLKEQHSFASHFRVQLLEKKTQLEEELAAVNQALVRTDKKLHITNQGLADRKEDMAAAIQLFPSLSNRKAIVQKQLKHCNDFWANLWHNVLDSL